jgi:AraC-like DNA-binding protein
VPQTTGQSPGCAQRPPATALLQRFPRVRTGDAAEFVAALNACYGPATVSAVASPRCGAGHELRAITGPGFTLGYVRSRLGVRIGPGEEDGPCYLNLAVSGTVRSQSGDEQLLNRAGLAAVLSAGQVQGLQPADMAAETVGIKLDGDLIDAELSALLGRPSWGPARFKLGLDLTTLSGRGINALAWALLTEASQPPGGLFDQPAVQRQYVRTLAIALLLSHQHNYSQALRDAQAPLRPRSLRRALEYIESHLAATVTVTDIAAAAGCSARTLHEYFREHVGASPMGYLRELRLQRVHQELRRTGRPVTDVAYAWGFTHLGRFSAAYRRRFGELPSHTARRA